MAGYPHAALVRKGYEAFTRGDFDTLRELLSGDCPHHVPGSHPLSGNHKGQDSILDLYRRLGEERNHILQGELRHVLIDCRGHAVALYRFTAERQGKRLDENAALVLPGRSGSLKVLKAGEQVRCRPS